MNICYDDKKENEGGNVDAKRRWNELRAKR